MHHLGHEYELPVQNPTGNQRNGSRREKVTGMKPPQQEERPGQPQSQVDSLTNARD
jgi:hypothetical protein